MEFTVLVDSSLIDLELGHDIDPISNKWLVSAVNEFEDGNWRYEKFQNFIWDNIAQTALTFREREALSGKPQSLLTEAARNLRLLNSDAIGAGSELAEILLYGIMRHQYNALPVVPKIFHKQNANDPAKGADSVHIVLDDAGEFSLWFGESKFYSSIENTRLSTVIESVGNALQTEKLRKENAIILNLRELDDLNIPNTTITQIRQLLANRTSLDVLKPRLNIPILLLHECELTAATTECSTDYVNSIIEYHKDRAVSYFSKQVASLGEIPLYQDIKFHLILFPVPEKQPIIERFIATTEFLREITDGPV